MRRATIRVAAQLTSWATHLMPPVHARPVTRARSRSGVWSASGIPKEALGKRKATTRAGSASPRGFLACCVGATPGVAYARGQHRSRWRIFLRSEEHTSELQSPCNLVCRLLLEKKKKTLGQRINI